MSSNWPIKRLGDYSLKIGSGATPKGGKSGYLDDGPYNLIRSQNIYNTGFSANGLVNISEAQAKKLNSVAVESGDILLNITGDSVARVCQVPEKYLPARVNQHVAIIRPDPHIFDTKFLRYFLASPMQQSYMLQLAASGATRNALTKSMIENFLIPCPPIREQQAIANILGAFDDKIEINCHMNETLETIAHTLFKNWFIDFEPVRAKMEGHWRRGESMRGLTAHFYDLFPAEFVESELGLIPRDWNVKQVADIGKIICGKTPATKQPEYYGNEIPFITIPDMHGKIFSVTTQKNLSQVGAATQPNKTLPPYTICVSCIATPGLVIITSKEAQTNQQINSVVPNNQSETVFWYWVFRHLADEIRASGSGGSVLSNLSTSRFSRLNVLAPPKELIRLYSIKCQALFESILCNEKETLTLATLRDTLLPKLISGEIRLKYLEKIIGDAT